MRVKEICREKGITLKQLAERMGVPPESLSRAISDKGNPTLSTMRNIAEALGVPIVNLLEAPASGNLKCPNCLATLRLSAEIIAGSIFD
jgi:transcriptional regulator with XRE-family HTH domain